MSTPPQDSDALAAAKGLTGALEGMTAQLKALTAYGRRNRHMIAALAVSLAFDLILTAVVAVFAVQAHDANTSAAAARQIAAVSQQASRNLCESSNVARAQQLGLWQFLFRLAGPAKTKEGAKLDREFLDHVATVFAPRNCSHVNPGKP